MEKQPSFTKGDFVKPVSGTIWSVKAGSGLPESDTNVNQLVCSALLHPNYQW